MTRLTWFIFLTFASILWAGKNMLPNESLLEIDHINRPKGWYGVVSEGCGIDKNERPEEGVYSVKVAGETCLETQVRVQDGRVYNCSWWLKTQDFNWRTEAAFQVVWLKQGKYLMTTWEGKPTWNMNLRNVHGTHNWTRFELNGLVAPADADGACVRILQVFESSGVCWYAKMRMEEAKQGEMFANRIATVPPCPVKMDLTKAFDESAWSQAAMITNYLTPVSGAESPYKSETRIMMDDDAIWTYSCNYQENIKEAAQKQYKLGHGHCIELFFLPPGQEYEYHAIISVTGTLFTCRELVGDQSWPMTLYPWEDNGITYQVKILEDRWQVVARTPFKGMGCVRPKDMEEWRANFCRTVGSSLSSDSSWSFLKDERFQNASCFGMLRFTDKAVPQVKNVSFSLNGAMAEICNVTDSQVDIAASLVNHNGDECSILKEKNITLAPNQNTICEINYPTKSADMRFLEVRSNARLIGKYSALPSQEHLAFYVFDPENVRTQTVYLAVDTPFFMAFSMKHNFPSPETKYQILNRHEKAFDLFMELPSSLKLRGISFDGIDWMQRKMAKAEPVERSADGKIVTYKMEMPLIINWAPHGFLLFYECDAPENQDLTGSYYFTHDDVVMPRYEMQFRTMKIGKVKKPFEHLVYEIDLLTAQTLYNWLPKDTVKRYLEFGLNRIEFLLDPMQSKEFYQGDTPESNEQIYDLLVQQARNCPDKIYFSTLPTASSMEVWRMTGKDPDSWAKTIDGSKMLDYNSYPKFCPSYRGTYYTLWRDRLVNSIAFAKYRCTWLATDLEIFSVADWDKICFCKRCLEGFSKYCIDKGHEDFAKQDVQAILLEGKSPELKKLWVDYMNFQYVDSVMTTVNQVKELVKGAKSTSPFEGFTLSDWTYPGSPIGTNLDLYEISAYYTPNLNYKKYRDLVKQWPNHTKKFICSTTLGQTLECPDFFVTEDQVKDTLYESAAFGMRGVLWFYFVFTEPRRMHAIVNGMNTVRPYEDIVANGIISWDFNCDNSDMQVTELIAGSERIIGIRAYDSEEDLTGVIRLQNIMGTQAVYDCETGKQLGTISSSKSEFSTTAPKGHCRLLYVGTEKQWQARNQ